jgi:hypothetical protein
MRSRVSRPPTLISCSTRQRGQAPWTFTSVQSSRARRIPKITPAASNVGTRMKCATGMKSPNKAKPQNIPAPASARSTRWPGLRCTSLTVTSVGRTPNAVSAALTSIELIATYPKRFSLLPFLESRRAGTVRRCLTVLVRVQIPPRMDRLMTIAQSTLPHH